MYEIVATNEVKKSQSFVVKFVILPNSVKLVKQKRRCEFADLASLLSDILS